MEAGTFFVIVLIALLTWLIGQSFIDSFFEKKEEFMQRMYDFEKGEE